MIKKLLLTCTCLLALQACWFQQKGTEKKQVDEYAIALTIDELIKISLSDHKTADYRIHPRFHHWLPDSVIEKSLRAATAISFSKEQRANLLSQYTKHKNKPISNWIIAEDKKRRLSDSYDDIIVIISPPMILNNRNIVLFYTETQFFEEGPEEEIVHVNQLFYAFKLPHEHSPILLECFPLIAQ